MEYKRCSRGEQCVHPDGPLLPATRKFFHPNNGRLYSICKACVSKERRDRRASDPEYYAQLLKRAASKRREQGVPALDRNYRDGEKFCVGCEQWKPATTEYFHAHKRHRRDGLASRCKECRVKQERERLQDPQYRERYSLRRKEQRRAQGIPAIDANIRDGERRCSVCREWKPATQEYFSTDKKQRDGCHSWCRECASKDHRTRYANDPELRKKEIAAAIKRGQRPDVREKSKRRARERYANPEYKKLVSRKARERRKNPEVKLREKLKQREWLQTERGKALSKAKNARRRARKQAAEGAYTIADLESQYRSQKGLCWHCGTELNGKYSPDHLIPLAKGGTNWPNNIVLSCQHCNLSKGDKFVWEWSDKLL